MKICRNRAELDAQISALSPQTILGFVPTMGALHLGHISLVKRSLQRCDYTVVSIFVNPTQFNNQKDFQAYPIDTNVDAEMLQEAGADLLFLPAVEEMYPSETVSGSYDLGFLEETLEGGFRAGHFQGVATIVDRFFSMVKPDVAFFGEKDYQQIAVIKRMVELKKHQVEIEACPNIREDDGLAMSSRNRRLSAEERRAAPAIFKAMNKVNESKGRLSPKEAKQAAWELLEETGVLKPEYLEIVDEISLSPASNWHDSQQLRVFVAAHAGNTRLIDNLSIR